MERTVSEIIGNLPKERKQRIEYEFQHLEREVESLRKLRQATGKAQAKSRRRVSDRKAKRRAAAR
jgi:hypothetical protein